MISVEAVGPFPSAANLTKEHPMARAGRVALVHERVREALCAQPVTPPMLADPLGTGHQVVVVRMTRLSPQGLDDDNLASAMKGCRDAIAAWLGVDDRDTNRVRYFCYQGRRPTVVVQPTGRQRKAKRYQTVAIDIRPEYLHPVLGQSLEELRRNAELASIRYELAAADAKRGGLEKNLGDWLGMPE